MADAGSSAYGLALVAELARKSGLLWVGYAGRTHPVWHAYLDGAGHDGAVCVVSGGGEQPLPEIAEQPEVTLILRSKASRHQVARARARVEVVAPGTPSWDVVTAVLAANRLNLVDPSTAAARWAAGSVVVKLVPSEVLATPGTLPDDAARQQPVDTPATTNAAAPFVLGRRGRAGRSLSSTTTKRDPRDR